MRFSLRVRAITAAVAFGVVVMAVFIFLAVSRHHRVIEEQTRENYFSLLRILAEDLEQPLVDNAVEAAGHKLSLALQDSDIIYLVLRGGNGRIFLQLQKQVPRPIKLDFSSFQPVARATFRELGGEPVGLFHQQGHIYEFTQPIGDSGSPGGWIQMGIFTAKLNQAIADATYWGARVLLVFLVIGIAVIALIDRRIRQTIHALIGTMRAMADGDLARRVEIRTGDELEQMGGSFNRMAEALREREEKILHYQGDLEKIVADRTQEVREEKAKLQAILDHVPSGFLLLDSDLRVLTASANFERLSGRKATEVIGKPCGPNIWPEKSCHGCPSQRALQTHKIETQTLCKKGDDGDERFFEQMAIPILSRSSFENFNKENREEPESVLEIVTDITERHRLQQKMLQAERLAATGELAAVIAHEMRNGLTSIKMILQLFARSRAADDNQRSSIGVALDSLAHLESTVNQLLQFARPQPLNRQRHDLNELAQQSVELFQHESQAKGIVLSCELNSDLPPMEVDGERFKEALMNLLLNAADAVKTPGKVVLRTAREILRRKIREPLAYVAPTFLGEDHKGKSATPAEGQSEPGGAPSSRVQEIMLRKGIEVVRVTVEDNGPGIPSQLLPKIFVPFFTTKINGTGLGLPLVRRFANEHGGVVLVETEENVGTRFSIILPTNKTQ